MRQGSHPIKESWLNTPLITNSAGKLVNHSEEEKEKIRLRFFKVFRFSELLKVDQ